MQKGSSLCDTLQLPHEDFFLSYFILFSFRGEVQQQRVDMEGQENYWDWCA